MRISTTTRLPRGMTNAQEYQTMGNAGIPDPSWANVFHDDFNELLLGRYTTTLVGLGSVTPTPFDGGAVLLSTSVGPADRIQLQLAAASIKLVAGKRTFYKFAGQLSDVVNCTFYAGLGSTDPAVLLALDCAILHKPVGVATLELVLRIGGVQTIYPLPATFALIAGIPFELGLAVSDNGSVEVFTNPSTGGALVPAAGTVRGPLLTVAAPTLTPVLLAPTIGLVNAVPLACTLTVDYHTVVRER